MIGVLDDQMTMLETAASVEVRGRVSQLKGLALWAVDLPVPIGSVVHVHTREGAGPVLQGEVVGFEREHTVIMPLGSTSGVRRGDPVIAAQFAQDVRVGEPQLGRVLDGQGRPIDGRGPILDTVVRPLAPRPVDPMDRPLIDTPLATGVRAIDALLPVGKGQRVGVFAAPGVGKSTLIGMMTKSTAADIAVIALVGERGREVREFIDNQLGPEGMSKSVVVCATSDEPALMRIRCAMLATSIAEYFRDSGRDVLLVMDSITRFCQAQRQVGLAAGEPPATKGYPPSVFAMLPGVLERSGRTSKGSITGFYTVLVEGDDVASDPVAEASRAVLDGHVLLSQRLANRGHWPAIDVTESISRVADDVTDAEHQAARREVLRVISSYQQVEDLVNIGAYAAGSNPQFDLAIAAKPIIDQLLQQGRGETGALDDFARTGKQLLAVSQQLQQLKKQLSQSHRARPPETKA